MNQVDAPEIRSQRSWLPAIVTGALGGAFIAGAWQTEGTLAAQRIMVNLIMPVGFAWLCSLYAMLACWKNKHYRSAAIALAAFVFIGVLFSPMTSRAMMRYVEAPVPSLSPLAEDAPKYRAAIVLGGGASLGRDGLAQFNTDGHRVAMAAQLWHAGKIEAIICTGEDNYVPDQAGNKAIDPDRWNPARLGIELLVSLGVPQDRLYRVGGINTLAEMKNLSVFLKSPPDGFPAEGDLGLITSAFHMRRSMRLAKAEGLAFVPIPVSYRTAPQEPIAIGDIIPAANAGQEFYLAAREMLARVVGR
jgi:uncharacterized SAM-binding protein YcdF (DUF218 family)